MIYNINFDIASVMLNAMLILIITFRRAYPSKSLTYYKWMLWLNLIAAVADIFSCYTICFPEKYPIFLNYLTNITYLTAHNLTVLVFLLYVLVLFRGNQGTRREQVWWKSVSIVVALLVLTTPFTDWVFYFDEQNNYCHGPLMTILYLAAFCFMVYSLVLFIYHRKRLNRFQNVVYIAFLTMMMCAIVFQYFFPTILVEIFCGSISFLMMNFALDNPAAFFYHNTYCFNHTAFNTKIGEKLEAKSPFLIISFTFDDLQLYKTTFGDKVFERIINSTIENSHKLYGQEKVFLRANSIFTLILDAKSDPEAEIQKIAARIGKVSIDEESLTLVPHFAVLPCTGEKETVIDINDTLNKMMFDIYQKTGKKIVYSDSKLLEATQEEARLIHKLHYAIRNDGFDVFYQPIFEQTTGKFISAEALVRLRNQDPGKYIGPDKFVPVAEKHGMILEIGEVLLEKVCRFWNEMELAERGICYVEVNLSMLQLLQRSTVERLDSICRRNGVPASAINFEITETANASSSERATLSENIEFLRQKGYSFSLDDYGSGYSTASYLAEMPFEIVKIDKSILWGAMKDPKSRIILENAIHLVKAFGKHCIVEGVENEEMASLLRELGCDFFQGYLYSRPLPGEDLIRFLRERV